MSREAPSSKAAWITRAWSRSWPVARASSGSPRPARPWSRSLVRSESTDGGRTWSEGKDSEFPNPNAAVDLQRLENGHLLLAYNDSMSERTPLRAAVSTDQGRTFPHRRSIASGKGDFAYPSARQTRDGKIRLVFTSEERTVINLAVFAESALLPAQ